MRLVCTFAVLCWAGSTDALTVTVDWESPLPDGIERETNQLSTYSSEKSREDMEWDMFRIIQSAATSDRHLEEIRHLEELELEQEQDPIEQDPIEQDEELTEVTEPDFCELWCEEPGSEGTVTEVNVSAVPIPATGLLLIGALAGLFGFRRMGGSRSG